MSLKWRYLALCHVISPEQKSPIYCSSIFLSLAPFEQAYGFLYGMMDTKYNFFWRSFPTFLTTVTSIISWVYLVNSCLSYFSSWSPIYTMSSPYYFLRLTFIRCYGKYSCAIKQVSACVGKTWSGATTLGEQGLRNTRRCTTFHIYGPINCDYGQLVARTSNRCVHRPSSFTTSTDTFRNCHCLTKDTSRRLYLPIRSFRIIEEAISFHPWHTPPSQATFGHPPTKKFFHFSMTVGNMTW